MGKYRIETEGGVYEIETADAPTAQPKPPVQQTAMQQANPWAMAPLGAETLAGVLTGAGKGIASTAVHGGDLLRRAFGQERIIDKPDVRELIIPVGAAQEFGFGVEKAGEFLAPTGLVGMGARAIQGATAGMRGATLAQLAARSALEGTAAASVTGLQTGGDLEAMRQAGLMGAGVTAGLGTAGMLAKPAAEMLKRSALTQYGRVLNPTKQGTKYLSQTQVAPGLLERGVTAGTLKTLQSKAGAQVQKWGQAISDAWANVPAGAAVDLAPVINNLDQSLADLYVTTSRGPVLKGPFAEQAVENVAKLKQTLADVAEVNQTTGALEVPVDRLRQLRQFFDDIASQAGRYQGKTLAEKTMAEAHGKAADAIRNELSQQFPDIAKINREFNFWKNAKQVVDETVLRREGQAKPLGRKLVGAAGAAAGIAQYGPLGAVMGKVAMDQLEGLVTGPAWGTVSAVMKDKLANALAKGNKGEIEFYLQKLLIGGTEAPKRLREATQSR